MSSLSKPTIKHKIKKLFKPKSFLIYIENIQIEELSTDNGQLTTPDCQLTTVNCFINKEGPE